MKVRRFAWSLFLPFSYVIIDRTLLLYLSLPVLVPFSHFIFHLQCLFCNTESVSFYRSIRSAPPPQSASDSSSISSKFSEVVKHIDPEGKIIRPWHVCLEVNKGRWKDQADEGEFSQTRLPKSLKLYPFIAEARMREEKKSKKKIIRGIPPPPPPRP